MEAVFGVTPGKRRNHTKGIYTAGRFSANGEGAKFSRSPLLVTANTMQVLARVPFAGGRQGVPGVPDAARNPHGLGPQFKLPGWALHQMAMLNVLVFAANNPTLA
jgi:catalase